MIVNAREEKFKFVRGLGPILDGEEKKFGSVWQPVGALKIPTFAKEKPLGATATQGRSRRGGPLPRRLPNIKKKVPFQKAEEEEEVARRDSDMSIDESDFL